MTRRFWGIILLAFALTAGLGLALAGEQSGGVPGARTAAERAWRSGACDEVERLAEPHAGDAALTIVRARCAAAVGDYARAESLLQPVAAQAPGGDAAIDLGVLQSYVGKRAEARRTLQLAMTAAEDGNSAREFLRGGRAAQALGRFEDANGFFRDAAAAAPSDVEINTAWGDLFLEKYNTAEAVKSFQAALEADDSYPQALVGMARALEEDNPPQAITFAQQALKLNARNVEALLVMAGTAVGRDRKAEAREWLGKVLAINPKSLEAIALAGALAYVEGDTATYQARGADALKIHPSYGEFYRVVGSVTAGYYRFDEAVEQVRRGIQLDRENWRAYGDLGAHMMRTGDERGARRALETAFRQDPYDVITYNLLGLLDTLDQFGTIKEGDLMQIRLHPEEAGVMEQYAPPLATEALAALSQRWEFTPKGPILIEMFPRHDDFAVRNVGLPGMIGALGACFGRVVTLDSPRARPPGEFNWGVTLWHEMAHVITLQLSEQRIPRWLTEGISVFEEKRARPEWGREMDLPFARAIDRKQVIPLKDLNSGFSSPETISLAYFQSSLVVEHIVEVFGQPKLRALVQSYARGIDTAAAIGQVLGVEIDALQKTFDAFLDQRYDGLRKALAVPDGLKDAADVAALQALAKTNPGSFPVYVELGIALKKSEPVEAIAAFEHAAGLVPNATGPDSPQAQIAEIALARGDKARAIKALDTLTGLDHSDLVSARKLASLLDPKTDGPLLQTALRRAVAVDPFDAPSHTTLGRMALAAGNAPEAVRMFRVALAADPVDRAGAHADLAEGYFEAGQKDAARREALAALEIAPTYSRAQDMLLRLRRRPVTRNRLLPSTLCLRAAALALVAMALVPPLDAQIPALPNDRLAGLQWTFARIRYHSWSEEGRGGPRMSYWEDPWAIDAPAAEQNLSRRIKSVTAIEVGEPLVLELGDERLWQYPWIYIVEPSNLDLREHEVGILREFLLRGGTLTMDDFHGPYEWDLTVRQLQRVFPDREIVELEPPHPIFTCFYRLEKYPQIPGLGSFLSGRTWEKGGFQPHLRAILDDAGRPMVLINWNTDMGDGVEWSNAEEYPGYIRWTALSYQMLINEVVYSLTH